MRVTFDLNPTVIIGMCIHDNICVDTNIAQIAQIEANIFDFTYPTKKCIFENLVAMETHNLNFLQETGNKTESGSSELSDDTHTSLLLLTLR